MYNFSLIFHSSKGMLGEFKTLDLEALTPSFTYMGEFPGSVK